MAEVQLTLVPETRSGRVRPCIVGGSYGPKGFSIAWPIWHEPATLSSIRGLLVHPDLRKLGALAYLGVSHVMTAQRISVGKFTNFSRARPIGADKAKWRARRDSNPRPSVPKTDALSS
jgi:hypothetical protein